MRDVASAIISHEQISNFGCCVSKGSLFRLLDYLFLLFRLAWWTSVGKELTSWLSACAVLLYAVLIVCVPFPYGVWGRMWNSILSVSDHCLVIYFSNAYDTTAPLNHMKHHQKLLLRTISKKKKKKTLPVI